MAAPRIFVSSTAFDLGHVRSQLRSAIQSLGYDAILSEYSDVLYDPRDNAQLSCVKELATCDAMVLIVGSRFGSIAHPTALAEIDAALLAKFEIGAPIEIATAPHASITQIELLKAVQDALPVFAFVEDRLLHDYATYLANREKAFVDEIQFASVSQPEFARYVFTFLDFLHARVVNNAIFSFTRVDEIESTLKRQWAALFQRLLAESRFGTQRGQRVDAIAEQIDDLKVAILSSIGDTGAREVARATLQFRMLLDMLRGLGIGDLRARIEQSSSWDELIKHAGVVEILESPTDDSPSNPMPTRVVLRMSDGRLLTSMLTVQRFKRLPDEWASFLALTLQQRLAVYDGIVDNDSVSAFRFRPTALYVYDEVFGGLVRAQAKTSDPVYGDEEPF